MKMAKASKADIDMAFELSQFVEELVDGYCPKQACEKPESEEIEWLDDDLDQLKRVIDALTSIARKGSIFRVVGGMAVVCDPKNELLDPEADTLEVHPKFDRLHAANVELLEACKTMIAWDDAENAAPNYASDGGAHWRMRLALCADAFDKARSATAKHGSTT